MNRLLKKNIIPPDGFRYRDPDTGFTATGGDYWTWIQNITAHRMANGLPVDRLTIELEAEEQLCSVLPPGWCEEWDPNRTEPLTRVTWGDVIQAASVFNRWSKEGRPLVVQAEAERRAKICSTCYLNVNVEGCGSCRKMADLFLGKFEPTSVDSHLVSCGACKCSLQAKVHFPLDVIETTDTAVKQNAYPSFCWLKRGGENYDPS